MRNLKNLHPEPLWRHFAEICRRPHASKKEEPVRRYFRGVGRALNLDTLSDRTGNVLFRKPATPGMEDRIPVVLQGHMDMVCEKNTGTVFDFDKDPIRPRIVDGKWVQAEGTTLGADNGIGVAAALAILESRDLHHGPLECLFTVDEETGLTGAANLEPGWIRGKILLNLDSENDEEICIGCAGTYSALQKVPFGTAPTPPAHLACRVVVNGLKGGHSGLDIHLGRGNANKILGRILLAWPGVRLATFQGGSRRNAIPREASACVVLAEADAPAFVRGVETLGRVIATELATSDPGLQVTVEPTVTPARVVDAPAQERFLQAMATCPNGVLTMDPDLSDLVRTSSNLATIHTEPGGFAVGTSQRSMIESEKLWAARRVESAFRLAGGEGLHGSGYPGWKPDLQSPALALVRRVFQDLRGHAPRAVAIHAGLECGMFKEKYPDLDMVSIGPNIQNPHSPDERIEIASVPRFWEFLVRILAEVPRSA